MTLPTPHAKGDVMISGLIRSQNPLGSEIRYIINKFIEKDHNVYDWVQFVTSLSIGSIHRVLLAGQPAVMS